mgnify:FL=1
MMTTRTRKNDLNEEKRIRILQLITVAAVVLFVLLLVALITNLVRLAGSNSRKAELEAQLAALDRQIEENNSIINYRQSEEYVDAYAREYLNMIGRDEEAFTGK